MRLVPSAAPLLLLCLAAACSSDSTTACCTAGQAGLRIVNAYPTAVDVLIDGTVTITSLSAGSVGTAVPTAGSHTLVLRPTGSSSSTGSVSQSITSAAGAVNTVAAVRGADGAVAAAVLDDTGSVVAAGTTKVRVLHLAPNAGTLQVYRTQPDYETPIAWQFPFTYEANPTSLSAPFYQSTVGTWEVRIWQTPADSSGWANAPIKVVLPLTSGQKSTIMILDKPGGGIQVNVL